MNRRRLPHRVRRWRRPPGRFHRAKDVHPRAPIRDSHARFVTRSYQQIQASTIAHVTDDGDTRGRDHDCGKHEPTDGTLRPRKQAASTPYFGSFLTAPLRSVASRRVTHDERPERRAIRRDTTRCFFQDTNRSALGARRRPWSIVWAQFLNRGQGRQRVQPGGDITLEPRTSLGSSAARAPARPNIDMNRRAIGLAGPFHLRVDETALRLEPARGCSSGGANDEGWSDTAGIW